MKTITRIEAVEHYGNDICKRHFKKNKTLTNKDIENPLIRTMLQHYESVERAGFGKGVYYILGDERPERIAWHEVKISAIINATKKRSRTYADDFYKTDTCTIYLATNIVTNESYVGSTTRALARRISEHKSHAYSENNANYKTHISQAIREYGFNAFTWKVIQHWDDEKTLRDAEDIWIINCKAFTKGYNSKFNHNKLKVIREKAL
ncbi:group I intron endonuclease [Paenisporosarcina sp. HGH0030]|uniref:GIY-YIG nuclease family protein n=1 Tax=Paenisporosarcina sp. HGH0030 TaxID=1078085 RepID=UPI00034EB60E|nr:GIY-YIG nuclease family protein [Paenisporosarcina sp. HGH0030]EPD54156.1 group I intron endonuclease [Paenisporosarcina sp. HGH0030]